MKTIQVHECDVCGTHAKEELDQYGGDEAYVVTGMVLAICNSCGYFVCLSCLNDGHCCQRKEDIEECERLKKETLFEL